MIFIFLNAGLVKIGEAGRIEDENQEHRNNNKDILKRQGHQTVIVRATPTQSNDGSTELYDALKLIL